MVLPASGLMSSSESLAKLILVVPRTLTSRFLCTETLCLPSLNPGYSSTLTRVADAERILQNFCPAGPSRIMMSLCLGLFPSITLNSIVVAPWASVVSAWISRFISRPSGSVPGRFSGAQAAVTAAASTMENRKWSVLISVVVF